MLTIKLKAADIRLLQAAKTEGELRGAVDLVLSKIQIHAQERELAKAEPKPTEPRFNVRDAVNVMREVLGEEATMPPFPGRDYFLGIQRTLRAWNLGEAEVRALAIKVRDTLKPPFQVSWVFANYERIMAGAVFGQAKPQEWRSSDKRNYANNPSGRKNVAWHGGSLDTKLED